MKILSLHQPWATLWAMGLKTYETRAWRTDYRGWIAVHATAKPAWPEILETIVMMDEDSDGAIRKALGGTYSPMAFPLGAIVGAVDVQDIYVTSPSFARNLSALERSLGDFSEGRYAWCATSPRRLDLPHPYRGAQGLRELPVEVSREIGPGLYRAGT